MFSAALCWTSARSTASEAVRHLRARLALRGRVLRDDQVVTLDASKLVPGVVSAVHFSKRRKPPGDAFGRLRPPAILKPGDQVKIVVGPFSDFVSTVETLAPDRRVWVMLELMDRVTHVAVAASDLRLVCGRTFSDSSGSELGTGKTKENQYGLIESQHICIVQSSDLVAEPFLRHGGNLVYRQS